MSIKSFLHLGNYLFRGNSVIITFLRSKGLLAQTMMCPHCSTAMHEATRNDISDGVRWRCATCKTSKSIRDGSFFSKSRLPLQKWLLLLYLWARDYPVRDIAQEAEIDKNVACDVMNWFREVCSTKLIRTVITLGGPGKIVQIDESLFRHKPKASVSNSSFSCFVWFLEPSR
jgi:transposase-like protein